ncbi:hypothetical protein TcBrA4_0052850 [Trypanosoma cruzi]|nr:hypothetical protein TcBrA4_0052850 [Trypanosoma cruzi]
MEIELSDDTAQAARISGGGVSFPQSTAQCVLRVSTGRSPVYMDSDQHLPSHTAGTEDGIPRRKHVALALREADCDASTTACVTPLATVTTWLEMRKCTIPRGSRDSPQKSRRTEWSRPSLFQRQHATSVLSYRRQPAPS